MSEAILIDCPRCRADCSDCNIYSSIHKNKGRLNHMTKDKDNVIAPGQKKDELKPGPRPEPGSKPKLVPKENGDKKKEDKK